MRLFTLDYMERRERIPPLTFKQAVETYGKVLEACKVPPDDVQRQLTGLQEPTIPEKQTTGFITLVEKLQASAFFEKH